MHVTSAVCLTYRSDKLSVCCTLIHPEQEIDDEVNSEVADVNSKVAGGFIMIPNIADEVAT